MIVCVPSATCLLQQQKEEEEVAVVLLPVVCTTRESGCGSKLLLAPRVRPFLVPVSGANWHCNFAALRGVIVNCRSLLASQFTH